LFKPNSIQKLKAGIKGHGIRLSQFPGKGNTPAMERWLHLPADKGVKGIRIGLVKGFED